MRKAGDKADIGNTARDRVPQQTDDQNLAETVKDRPTTTTRGCDFLEHQADDTIQRLIGIRIGMDHWRQTALQRVGLTAQVNMGRQKAFRLRSGKFVGKDGGNPSREEQKVGPAVPGYLRHQDGYFRRAGGNGKRLAGGKEIGQRLSIPAPGFWINHMRGHAKARDQRAQPVWRAGNDLCHLYARS